MTWAASADVSRFDEAVTWFRSLVPMTQEQYELIEDKALSRAFHIAAHLELHAVQEIHDEIAKAIEDGTPFEDFAKAVSVSLDKTHLETVFINANQQAYNVGRWEQMNDPALNALRPFRMFDAVLDGRTSPHCKAWDGVIRAWDDPCWQGHSPQCHHRCRSTLRSLRPSEAAERGITQTLPDTLPSSGFGLAPDHRSYEPPEPSGDDIDDDVWAAFEARVAQAKADLAKEQSVVDELRRKSADNDNQ
jgi:SPP1 gp7 family putative phage head morphogenesis protein